MRSEKRKAPPPYNGKFIPIALSSLRICVDDILEQLRLAGYSDINQIDSALIETNGQLSVIPKESDRPLTCRDVKLYPKQTHVPHTVISDGKLRPKNLRGAGIDEKWLCDKLKKYNVTDYSKVFYMSVSDEKEIFLQIKE